MPYKTFLENDINNIEFREMKVMKFIIKLIQDILRRFDLKIRYF